MSIQLSPLIFRLPFRTFFVLLGVYLFFLLSAINLHFFFGVFLHFIIGADKRAVILHEAAAKALKAAGVSKLPSIDALQAEYEKLKQQKEALYADYGKLKKQVKEYDVIKQNIDSILQTGKQPEREKETSKDVDI